MRARTPARQYPPGFFTEPVFKRTKAFPTGFPPKFTPASQTTDWRSAALSQRCSAQRDEAHAQNIGWGAGTIAELKGSGFQRPGWMGKS